MNLRNRDEMLFNGIGYFYIIMVSAVCLLPFMLMISGSITSEHAIITKGYAIIPSEISLKAYKIVFKSPEKILRAYGVSIFITVTGTFFGMWISSMTAYVLSRKDFRSRNSVAFYFYFTTLFNGGLIPVYLLVVKYLNLSNNLLALILPPMITAWNVLILRNFMKSIPDSITESAKIDGAGDFYIYHMLILPLSKPGLATIGLFTALNFWNDWHHAMLYIDNDKLMPLQYFLYVILSKADFMKNVTRGARIPTTELPTESLKMAMAIVATGPILFAYAFVQKYFVKGLIIGAVKG